MTDQRQDQPTSEKLIALSQCADGDARIGEILGALKATPDDLKHLDSVTRDRLIAKLRERKKGPWNNLAKGLGLLCT